MSGTAPHSDDERVAAAADFPLLRVVRVRRAAARVWGAVIAAACATVLVIAARLEPSGSNLGTHRGLGLPQCGFLLVTGVPCPTCGMTTSFSWMMHGHPLHAFLAQPLGALLCLGCAAAVILGVWTAVSGRYVAIDWYRFSPGWMALSIGLLIAGGWAGKIAFGVMLGELPQPVGMR